MNFKEVRLVGFKSFADKTSIKFDDGVTCIVGPNGCGKSNVADAVRWVLGEQSAKTLRGSSMQDVIFGGTETRRQLSYCEVTLVFDNTNKLFDIEYDEVAMTRRLYRSGESEYLLNMQPCRLKDIVALLHGVGIGREGYSIIGQGKVEQIMNAKPEDRRAIFEEATGVMKFKTQKGEIERKLENARDNLTVFVQRMDEAENQLRPLEKQAETAKKYREYNEKLRYEEVNAYLVRSDGFAQETARYRARIESAAEELAAVEAQLSEVDTEETAGREAIARADDRLRSLNENLRLFEVGIEHKSGEAKVLGERMKNYRRTLAEANETVGYSLRRTEEIERLVAESGKKTDAQRRRSGQIAAELDGLLGKLREADARYEAYERLSDEKRASELSSMEDLADARVNVGSLSAKRDAAQDRIAEVREAIRKAEGRKQAFALRLEECGKEKRACEAFLDGKPAREEEIASEIADLVRSEQRISEEVVGCNTTINNLTHNLSLYRDLKNRFNGYREAVRRLQLDARSDPELAKRIKGTIADIVSTGKAYETAIETAFGGAMQNIITATTQDANYLVRYLRETHAGIATFLPVDYMQPHRESREIEAALKEHGAVGTAISLVKYDPYYDPVVRNLLGNTLVCESLDDAIAIGKRYPHAFRMVTLLGDVIATGGSITGGSRKGETGNLLAGERRIKECEEEIAKKQALAEKLKKALAQCSAELDEARAQQDAFRAKVQEETANFAALAQKEIALKGLLETEETNVKDYGALLDRLTRTVDDLESEVLSSAENEDLLSRIRSEAAAQSQAQLAEVGKIKAEREELASKIAALRVEGASLETERKAEEEGAARLLREKEDLAARVSEMRARIKATEESIDSLKKEAEKSVLREDEREAVEALRKRLAEVEEEKRAVNARQGELAERKRSLLARQMTRSEDKHAAEIEISKAETTLENMRQRLEETYQLTYETAQAYRDENFDFAQANAEINSLKHKIGALGNVNMNAEEDYANLLARYTEMQTQKEDLDKGIADLTSVLNDLRDEMQRKFDAGFNEINGNFTRIFRELFGGGRAEMQLDYTDCDDPLNAGVEIIACPPGKKLTKISLLSGGERAFTAIAILFAILKSRPMPFCILDEIEAALDEANVDRFAKYLKKFSKDTQFIVITHRKPTMNQADVLFGVTMEEKGVSKIVSVKLSEVESRLGGDTVVA